MLIYYADLIKPTLHLALRSWHNYLALRHMWATWHWEISWHTMKMPVSYTSVVCLRGLQELFIKLRLLQITHISHLQDEQGNCHSTATAHSNSELMEGISSSETKAVVHVQEDNYSLKNLWEFWWEQNPYTCTISVESLMAINNQHFFFPIWKLAMPSPKHFLTQRWNPDSLYHTRNSAATAPPTRYLNVSLRSLTSAIFAYL